MVQHFDISREKSIRAIETAMMGNQKVYLVTQRHPEQETPAVADLYQMGTISQIKQLVKMPGGIIRVMVEGEKRAALLTLFEEGPYLEAEVEEAPMQEEQLTDTVKEAMSRIVIFLSSIISPMNATARPLSDACQQLRANFCCVKRLP